MLSSFLWDLAKMFQMLVFYLRDNFILFWSARGGVFFVASNFNIHITYDPRVTSFQNT